MANEYWLCDRAWASIEPLMPTNQPGARRVGDRRVISGIIHVLKSGCRWKDCPAVYGPPTTIYNRFNRWSRKRLWQKIFETLVAGADLPDDLSIESTAVRAHRSTNGLKRGAQAQAIGRSRGGRTIKIHALTDGCGAHRRYRLSLNKPTARDGFVHHSSGHDLVAADLWRWPRHQATSPTYRSPLH